MHARAARACNAPMLLHASVSSDARSHCSSVQSIPPARIEALFAMIGRLPLEFVLLSFLFQLVDTYVDFNGDTLAHAVMKRLQASHANLQARFPC
jgi:hypothetical protein